jgi:hypothetical protein
MKAVQGVVARPSTYEEYKEMLDLGLIQSNRATGIKEIENPEFNADGTENKEVRHIYSKVHGNKIDYDMQPKEKFKYIFNYPTEQEWEQDYKEQEERIQHVQTYNQTELRNPEFKVGSSYREYQKNFNALKTNISQLNKDKDDKNKIAIPVELNEQE